MLEQSPSSKEHRDPLWRVQQCTQPLVNPKHIRSGPLWLLELPVKSLAHLLVCNRPTLRLKKLLANCLLATEITTVTVLQIK